MPVRVPSCFVRYTNPRTIAGLLAGMMDDGLLSDEAVHVLFQQMRSDRCSVPAVSLVCDRFLHDYAALKSRHGSQTITREVWDVFLDETVHFIKQVSGGRVRWKTH